MQRASYTIHLYNILRTFVNVVRIHDSVDSYNVVWMNIVRTRLVHRWMMLYKLDSYNIQKDSTLHEFTLYNVDVVLGTIVIKFDSNKYVR